MSGIRTLIKGVRGSSWVPLPPENMETQEGPSPRWDPEVTIMDCLASGTPSFSFCPKVFLKQLRPMSSAGHSPQQGVGDPFLLDLERAELRQAVTDEDFTPHGTTASDQRPQPPGYGLSER